MQFRRVQHTLYLQPMPQLDIELLIKMEPAVTCRYQALRKVDPRSEMKSQ